MTTTRIYIYSACGSFGKNTGRIQKLKETEDLGYIYQNKLDKTCFQHKLAYGGLKDLTRRTASDKKWWFINFFDKRTSDSGIKNENISNKELAEELHKAISRKFKKEKYTHLL